MKLTEDQAAALTTNVAIASLHHSEDLALVDEGKTAYSAVTWALSALDGVVLSEGERDELRVLAGRAITDPTAYRGEFIDRVLGAVDEEAGAAGE